MRCVVQRSGPARVMIDGETVGAIDHGLVVLAAFAPGDGEAELSWMARKLPALRIFNDAEGKMNRSLRDLGDRGDAQGGGILLVSQFTLYGDCRKGNRPSFVNSAAPEAAAQLYERFGKLLRQEWPSVAEGRFGAMMTVELTNQGPVTLIVERNPR